MTVKELIEKLKKFDDNLEVIISADGGVFEIDDALIKTETWKTKDDKDIELLDICFDQKQVENAMTVQELIKKLSSLDSDSQVYVQFMNGDAYGSCWEDREYFDEDDVKVDGDIVILDISDKQKISIYIRNKTCYNNHIN